MRRIRSKYNLTVYASNMVFIASENATAVT
uniref:Uncharacterized protein n=1 Tax=Anguilla anguilla TaxID=7936 RepID=A0A0E9W972_ANGAN